MKKMYSFLCVLFVFSCTETGSVSSEITAIDMTLTVKRFDYDFYHATATDFSALQKKYPYFMSGSIEKTDSIWKQKKQDTLEVSLLKETNKAFPDFKAETKDLILLFQHIKHVFPSFKKPEVVTSTSMVAYQDKVLLQDNILLIAIDTYLGASHEFYEGLPKYVSDNLTKEQLVSDVAELYAKKYVVAGKQRLFVEQMVYFGKLLYIKDKIMPFKSEASRIGYSEEQLSWAIANEQEIWRYFVEKDLVFSTDTALAKRFLVQAPFSKFYLELDSESPGMLGRYIGWQIVRSFMEKNDVSLQELTRLSGTEIFKKSTYKPRK